MIDILQLCNDQLRGLHLDMFLIAIYLVAIFICKAKDLYVCTLASIVSQAFSLSPLYRATLEYEPSAVFLIYSFIYFTVIRYLSTYKVMLACFIMAVFELIVYKAYRDEIGVVFVEGFLYDNYELLVTLCHLVIINSVIDWRKVVISVRDYCLPLLRTIRNVSLSLPY